MESYELTIVLPGEVSAAKKKSMQALIEKLVNAGKGEIKKTDEWGKIDLAYKIRKEAVGTFTHYNLAMNPAAAKNLKDKIRLESDILRYLLVRV